MNRLTLMTKLPPGVQRFEEGPAQCYTVQFSFLVCSQSVREHIFRQMSTLCEQQLSLQNVSVHDLEHSAEEKMDHQTLSFPTRKAASRTIRERRKGAGRQGCLKLISIYKTKHLARQLCLRCSLAYYKRPTRTDKIQFQDLYLWQH